MFSFKGILGSSVKVSSLEAALQNITFDDAGYVYETVSDPDLRVPTAISMTVLKMAHNFSKSLLKMESEFSKKMSLPNHQTSYDAVVWEAAAYAHFWSMKDYLRADLYGDFGRDEDDEGEDYEEEEDIERNLLKSHYAKLMTSTLMTGAFVGQLTAFDIPDRNFANRAVSYWKSNDTQIKVIELNSRLEHNLMNSILTGKPINQKPHGMDLPLDITLKACILIFQTNSLVALSQIADTLVKESEVLKG